MVVKKENNIEGRRERWKDGCKKEARLKEEILKVGISRRKRCKDGEEGKRKILDE